MITANNGILIVAMLFAWALKVGDQGALVASVLAAMFSYVTNAADEFNATAVRWVGAFFAVAFVCHAFWRLSVGG